MSAVQRPAPVGMLFDVDGPLASPETRTVAIPSILDDLVTLVSRGIPVSFITGRSDAFIREQVVEPLLAVGLGDALDTGGAGMFGVFEKGAVWAPITGAGMGELVVDASVALPTAVVDDARSLVEQRFADTMFFDETKLAMISVEQRTDVDSQTYQGEQTTFNTAVFDLLSRHGLGVRYGAEERPDSDGRIPFRVDPTIISTDVESVSLDKDRGAERALAYFSEHGDLPSVWRTVGDSRSDYLMADHLHAAGYDVAHVDVRPSDGILDRDYRIITMRELIHDEAGAAFLRRWVERTAS